MEPTSTRGLSRARGTDTGPAMLIHYAVTRAREVPDSCVTSAVDDVVLVAALR